MTTNSTSGVYATLPDLIRMNGLATGFSFLPRQPVHSLLAGAHASKLRGRGLNFEELRRYLPGDDIRQIDWKVTARTRKPHVRVYTEERERPVFLVVDQRLSMFFGSQRNLKSVTAAEAAALAAWRTIAVKDRVGAVAFNDSQTYEIRPHRSRATVMSILQRVVELNHRLRVDSTDRPNPQMLNNALRRAARLAPHDCLIVIITDGDGGDAETQQIATQTAQHNDVLVVFVFDPLEAELPSVGRMVVSDGQRELDFDSHSASLRRDYQSDFVAIRQKAHHFLMTRDVPVLPLSTAEPTIDQFLHHLSVHARRHA